MKRLSPILLCLLFAGCDINIGDGGGGDSSDTEGSGGSADESGGPGDSAGSAGSSDGNGETGGGSDPTNGGGTTDPSGDPDPTGAGETDPTGFGETSGTSGGFADACNDELDCQSCYQCSVLPGNSCSDALDACTGDADCSAMVDCQSACATTAATQQEFDTCVGTCAVDTPDGILLFNDLVNCREETCSNTCFGGGSECDLQGDCQSCANCVGDAGGSCEAYVDACNQNFDCIDLVFCQQDCIDTSTSQGQLNACFVNCESTFPAGVPPLLDLNACTNGLCPVSCAG